MGSNRNTFPSLTTINIQGRPVNFEQAIQRHGQLARLLSARKCACIKQGAPLMGCPLCGGKGYRFSFQSELEVWNENSKHCMECATGSIAKIYPNWSPLTRAIQVTRFLHPSQGGSVDYPIISFGGNEITVDTTGHPLLNYQQVLCSYAYKVSGSVTDENSFHDGSFAIKTLATEYIYPNGMRNPFSIHGALSEVTRAYNVTQDYLYTVLSFNKRTIILDGTPAPVPRPTPPPQVESHLLAFTVNGNQYTVTGIGTETSTNIKIPSAHLGKAVTAIGVNAFQGSGLTSITIPNSIVSIGAGAFLGCPLATVTIPSSVTSIGDGAFVNGSMLTIFFDGLIPPTLTGVNFFGDYDTMTQTTVLGLKIYVPISVLTLYKTGSGAKWTQHNPIIYSSATAIPPPLSTDVLEVDYEYVKPLKVATGRIEYEYAIQKWGEDIKQGDIEAVIPGTYAVARGDIITFLVSLMKGQDVITRGSGDKDELPQFDVYDILEKIEDEDGVTYFQEDFSLVNYNELIWLTATRPATGKKYSITYRYHPSYVVYKKAAGVVNAEDKIFPQNIFLRLINKLDMKNIEMSSFQSGT